MAHHYHHQCGEGEGEGDGNDDYSAELRVEMSNEWPADPSEGRDVRYVDNYAVSSQPHYAIPYNSNVENEQRESAEPSNYIASALVTSGVNHHILGEHEKALKAFHAALKAQRRILGDEHICVAHTLGNIGAVYLRQGKLELATKALEEALEMKIKLRTKQKNSGRGRIVLADVLNNLGNVAYLRGDYTISLQYYRMTLKDLRSRNGSEKDIANALHNIGRLNIHQREWDAALSVLTECHRMEVHLYGHNSIQLSDTLELLGYVHLSSMSLDAAIVSFSEALSIIRESRGPCHADVASCLYNIGLVREAKGQLGDAWEAYAKARDLYFRAGVDHAHGGFKAARRSVANIEQLIAFTKDSEGHKQRSRFIPIDDVDDEQSQFYA